MRLSFPRRILSGFTTKQHENSRRSGYNASTDQRKACDALSTSNLAQRVLVTWLIMPLRQLLVEGWKAWPVLWTSPDLALTRNGISAFKDDVAFVYLEKVSWILPCDVPHVLRCSGHVALPYLPGTENARRLAKYGNLLRWKLFAFCYFGYNYGLDFGTRS